MLIHVVSLLILAFALSLDSFGVGITYGMRRLRIPWTSIVVIACCSGLILFLSMQIGNLLIQYVCPAVVRWMGSFILIGIGCWAILQLQPSSDEEDGQRAQILTARIGAVDHIGNYDQQVVLLNKEPKQVIPMPMRILGVVIQILKTPSTADLDGSGIISAAEAAWLGAALSMDAFGVGIGAALLGYPSFMTAVIIALFNGVFLCFGIRIGIAFAGVRWIGKLSFVPGLMLIMMGIVKLVM